MPGRLITVGVLVVSEKPYAVPVPEPADVHLVEGDVGGELTVHAERPAVEMGGHVDERVGYVEEK